MAVMTAENTGSGLRAAGLAVTFLRRRSMFLMPSGTLVSPSFISNAAQRPSRSSMMASTSKPSESP